MNALGETEALAEAAARRSAEQARIAYLEAQLVQSIGLPASNHVVDFLKDMAEARDTAADPATSGSSTQALSQASADTRGGRDDANATGKDDPSTTSGASAAHSNTAQSNTAHSNTASQGQTKSGAQGLSAWA